MPALLLCLLLPPPKPLLLFYLTLVPSRKPSLSLVHDEIHTTMVEIQSLHLLSNHISHGHTRITAIYRTAFQTTPSHQVLTPHPSQTIRLAWYKVVAQGSCVLQTSEVCLVTGRRKDRSRIRIDISLTGELRSLNDLARKAKADYIIHTGDFGFYDNRSLERIAEKYDNRQICCQELANLLPFVGLSNM